jgi:hypothetical protein
MGQIVVLSKVVTVVADSAGVRVITTELELGERVGVTVMVETVL